MHRFAILLTVVVSLGLVAWGGPASAQCYVAQSPIVTTAPAVTYYSAPTAVTTYYRYPARSVAYYTPAPVYTTYYALSSTYTASYAPSRAYTTYYAPGAVYSTYYAPSAAPYVAYYQPGVVVAPKVYVRGQPVRNLLRAITP